MAIVTSRIRSDIIISSSYVSPNIIDGTSILQYSSLLYTVPSGKIAKVITQRFDKNLVIAYGSFTGSSVSYFLSALGIHCNNSLYGIREQARINRSNIGSEIIDASIVESFTTNLANHQQLKIQYDVHAIFAKDGGMSYHSNHFSYLISGSEFLGSSTYINSFIRQSSWSSSVSTNSYLRSEWTAGPDHCYLSSGDQLIASINLTLRSNASFDSGAYFLAALQFDYLVLEETAS